MSFDNLRKYLPANYARPDVVDTAIDNLKQNKVHLLGISGKKASGKDTFAHSFGELYKESTGIPLMNLAFAEDLKREATSVIDSLDDIAKTTPKMMERSFKTLSKLHNIPYEQFEHLAKIIDPVVGKGAVLPPNGWTRSKEVWAVLAYLGTEIRQKQDRIYWVRPVAQRIIENAAEGKSSFITDIRFPHEYGFMKDSNGFVFRIFVTPETQRNRLFRRDGVVPTDEALNHQSEIGLDSYSDFDFVLDNNIEGKLEEKAEKMINAWKNRIIFD